MLSALNVRSTPAVVQLASEEEDAQAFMAVSPELLLLRWVNHHVRKAGYAHKVSNFSSDIKDGEVYTLLLTQIAPGVCDRTPLVSQGLSRATKVKEQAGRIGCDCYVTAADIVGGVPRLNLAFVANLFQKR